MRGQDVEAIAVFGDEGFRNYEFLEGFAKPRGVSVLVVPKPPPAADAVGITGHAAAGKENEKDRQAMTAYYATVAKSPEVGELLHTLETRHQRRIERLESMAAKARDVVWYPFTQHHGMTAADITAIDSAHGDCFQTLVKPKPQNSEQKPSQNSSATTAAAATDGEPLLQPTFDGSASWWTQGLGHGDPELARTAAYAAGRYGHVMFPGTIHEPALSLCERLLKLSQNPRLQRVFFGDNGSVGMEVAVKMGLRAASKRYGWSSSSNSSSSASDSGSGSGSEQEEIGILGLSGSYHGDTLGAMECSEPSTFNKKVEWYRGRGHWMDFPQAKMTRGVWKVVVPESMGQEGLALSENSSEFASLAAIFDLAGRKESDLARWYKTYVRTTLEDLVVRQGRRFGALIIEPVVLGAGGMLFS